MPRILHIINKLDIGGAEIMLLDILKYADKQTFDYHILLPYGKGDLDSKALSLGLNLHHLDNSSPKSKFKLYKEGVDTIKKINPDLIHTHTRFSDLVGMVGGRSAGVKTRIMTVHNSAMYFLDTPPFIEGLVELGVVRYAKHFVVITKAVYAYLRKYGRVSPDKITLIYNGIDPDRACLPDSENRDQIRNKYGISSDDFVFITVRRLIHEKGIDILIDEFAAFRKSQDKIKLVIVGDGVEKTDLTNRAAKSGFENDVIFTGWLESPYNLLKASDCFVIPSRNEGFGLVIIEAMANGIPVIASNTGGIPEIIKHNSNGILFDVFKNGELAAALKKIHRDKELVKKLVQNGNVTAFEKFHVKFTSMKYEKLYLNLLSETN